MCTLNTFFVIVQKVITNLSKGILTTTHCVKYGFSLTHISSYKDWIENSVHIWENTGQRKRIIYSDKLVKVFKNGSSIICGR